MSSSEHMSDGQSPSSGSDAAYEWALNVIRTSKITSKYSESLFQDYEGRMTQRLGEVLSMTTRFFDSTIVNTPPQLSPEHRAAFLERAQSHVRTLASSLKYFVERNSLIAAQVCAEHSRVASTGSGQPKTPKDSSGSTSASPHPKPPSPSPDSEWNEIRRRLRAKAGKRPANSDGVQTNHKSHTDRVALCLYDSNSNATGSLHKRKRVGHDDQHDQDMASPNASSEDVAINLDAGPSLSTEDPIVRSDAGPSTNKEKHESVGSAEDHSSTENSKSIANNKTAAQGRRHPEIPTGEELRDGIRQLVRDEINSILRDHGLIRSESSGTGASA